MILADRPWQFGPAALFALFIGVAPAFAQDPQVPGPEPVVFLSSNMIQGDLLRVDVEAERLVLKPVNGAEVEVRFNRRTALTGVNNVRELASRAGARVSVKFSKHDGDKVATSIRVHPKLEVAQRRDQSMPR